jgi:hypothetical protein
MASLALGVLGIYIKGGCRGKKANTCMSREALTKLNSHHQTPTATQSELRSPFRNYNM